MPGAGAVWLSITVDGDTFDESDKPALHPLTDWHIVVAPPLVIENTLPIAGHYIVWERPQVRLRLFLTCEQLRLP